MKKLIGLVLLLGSVAAFADITGLVNTDDGTEIKLTSPDDGTTYVLQDAAWTASQDKLLFQVDTDALTVGTNKATMVLPKSFLIDTDDDGGVGCAVTGYPTGSDITVDITADRMTIMESTKITIEEGEWDSRDAVAEPVVTYATLANGSIIGIDVDAVGSGVAGSNLNCWISGTWVNDSYGEELSYAEGGPSFETPPAGLTVRYVDADTGSDSNDGLTPDNAWETTGEVATRLPTLPVGTHILFKRGTTNIYSGSATFTGADGTADNPYVFGAYGPVTDSAPKTGDLEWDNMDYVTIRDLDAKRLYLILGSSHYLIYNNRVGGDATRNYSSNGIGLWSDVSYVAIIGNKVWDVKDNDGILLHSGTESLGSHHWVIDNIVIGNNGLEQGIDIAMSETDKGDPYIATDVKIIGNRVYASALAGTSIKIGDALNAMTVSHEGEGVWVVGNIFAGGRNDCLFMSGEKQDVSVKGNIMFGCNIDYATSNQPVLNAAAIGFLVENNTLVHSVGARNVLQIEGTDGVVQQNHIVSNRALYQFSVRVDVATLPDDLITLNNNYYDVLASASASSMFNIKENDGSPSDSYTTIALMQVDYPTYETDGAQFNISAKTEPTTDPFQWDDDWLSAFAAEFSGNACADGIGALACDGSRLGLVIDSLPDIGIGWTGPPLVRKTLKELGVSY